MIHVKDKQKPLAKYISNYVSKLWAPKVFAPPNHIRKVAKSPFWFFTRAIFSNFISYHLTLQRCKVSENMLLL